MRTTLLRLCVVILSTATAVHVSAEDARLSLVVGKWLPGEKTPSREPSGIATPLDMPFGVAFDSHGVMSIVEYMGGRVFQLKPQGRDLLHVAGIGGTGFAGDDGPAIEAQFHSMHNIAIGPDDAIYLSDSFNHRIRRIDPSTSIVSTFAGTGEPGFSGDHGPAQQAKFHDIMCIAFRPDGKQLLMADLRNRRVRAIDMETHVVTTLAGNGRQGVPQDGTPAGDAPLVDPRAVAADREGRVYVLERGGHALRRIEIDGTIRTVAGAGKPGFDDGAARSAQLRSPKHLCIDDQGRVLIADDQNHAIRRYDPSTDRIETVLGQGVGEVGIQLKNPHGVTYYNRGIYVVDSGNHRILRIEEAAN